VHERTYYIVLQLGGPPFEGSPTLTGQSELYFGVPGLEPETGISISSILDKHEIYDGCRENSKT
jgi:hypothetical protein